jgi:C_GCAxxG_C_C family probable redox protein
MTQSETAVNKFKEGYNCAQSVLFSYADKLGISHDLALKLSTGFGGGMGRKQEVCGAVSCGILVLNLLYGRGEHDDKQRQETAYSKVRELIDRFEEKHGTVSCRKLLDNCVLLTPEGQARFGAERMIDRCHEYVRSAVGILDDVIGE